MTDTSAQEPEPHLGAAVDPTERLEYHGDLLPDILTGSPLEWIARWYTEAVADPRIVEPGAMVVATVDADGHPNARTVLLKDLSSAGLTFFTNTESTKGQELAAHPWACAVLLWHPRYRQVRVRGPVTQLSAAAAQDYFASRPRGSQIATRVSQQSRPIRSRTELERLVAAEEKSWPDTGSAQDVPKPDSWGGYLLRPQEIELWVGQRSRLHDRVRFDAIAAAPAELSDAAAWRTTRLQP